MSEDKKLDHIEFETKYNVEPSVLVPFQTLVEKMPLFREFVFATGPDEYYVDKDRFVRYRKESHKGALSRAELTMKTKPSGAKNNIIREELNVRVDGTTKKTIVKFLSALGFEYSFTVTKNCFIYIMDDATLVYYSVVDMTDGTPKNERHFCEIEVCEDKIHEMVEADAWLIIEKYEKALESIGLNPHKRLRKSLFEMYER